MMLLLLLLFNIPYLSFNLLIVLIVFFYYLCRVDIPVYCVPPIPRV